MAAVQTGAEMADDLLATSSGFQPRFAALALDFLRSRLDWSAVAGPMLEAGCGHGDVTGLELLPRLPPHARVVAADSNDAALAEGARRYRDPRVCFLPLHIADRSVQNTAVWRLGPYARVFCFTLHWVSNRRLALQNIFKLLSPGGEVVLLVVSDNTLATMNEKLGRTRVWRDYLQGSPQLARTDDPSDKPEQLLKVDVQNAGFTIKTCCTKDAAFGTTDMRDIKDLVMAINPYVSKIPKEMRSMFLRECIVDLRKNGTLHGRLLTSDTLYIFQYDAIVVHAIKS